MTNRALGFSTTTHSETTALRKMMDVLRLLCTSRSDNRPASLSKNTSGHVLHSCFLSVPAELWHHSVTSTQSLPWSGARVSPRAPGDFWLGAKQRKDVVWPSDKPATTSHDSELWADTLCTLVRLTSGPRADSVGSTLKSVGSSLKASTFTCDTEGHEAGSSAGVWLVLCGSEFGVSNVEWLFGWALVSKTKGGQVWGGPEEDVQSECAVSQWVDSAPSTDGRPPLGGTVGADGWAAV